MKVLKNIANKANLSNKTVEQQIEILAEQFCDGMDYGYKIQTVTKGDDGFYTVTAVCPTGAMASTRFMWNPETQTDYYVGSPNDIDNKTWYIPAAFLEDYSNSIVNV